MFDGYVRVSQVGGRDGERFISPGIQREQIETWAEANNAVIGMVFEELDESGARADRPLLAQAIERVERGESDGIVVAKLDRFGRSLLDGLAAIDRISSANGTFVSVQDGFDLRTPTGKLLLRLMLSMAEWELDRIRSNWNAARIRAIQRGVHIGRTAPFGYRRVLAGRLEPDAATAPVLREIFKRRADGATTREIAQWLETHRVKTSRGNRGWTDTSVWHILRNRTYLGELRMGDHVARHMHPPLVGRATWQEAQSPRVLSESRKGQPTLLGGLLRCSACRLVLHSGWAYQHDRRTAAYHCGGRSAQGSCPEPAYITGPSVEPYVEEAFLGALSHSKHRPRAQSREAELQARVDVAERTLDSYRDNVRIAALLGEERFLGGLRARRRNLDLAMRVLANEGRRSVGVALPSAEELVANWPRMSVEERRAAIAEVIDCIFVSRNPGTADDRLFICYRGQAPVDLPRPGSEKSEFKRFDPAAIARPRKKRSPRRWSQARVRAALTEFLGEREDWPSVDEFLAAGRGPLYSQVLRCGGLRIWARRMNVRQPLRTRWDPTAAKLMLIDLSEGGAFPSQRVLYEAGVGGLVEWLRRNGGLDHWARECGLRRNRGGRRSPFAA